MCRGVHLFGTFLMLLSASIALRAQTVEKRPVTFHDLISMHRLSDPQISPDGKWIAYTVSTPDLETNRSIREHLDRAGGRRRARQLTRGGSNTRPRWSPDGKKLAFISARDGTPQVYYVPLAGGEATRVTSLSTGADNELWSPDGKTIAFVRAFIPIARTTPATLNATREKEQSEGALFTINCCTAIGPAGGTASAATFCNFREGGAPRDLTPGADYDVPPFNLGAPEAIAFSPDGSEIASRPTLIRTKRVAPMAICSRCAVIPARANRKRITTNPGERLGAGLFARREMDRLSRANAAWV